jgi:beta-glucosidase
MKSFPKNFLWGASTAAYQVEGDLHTQWSEWERAKAAELARTAPQRLAWLPHQERIIKAMTDPDNYVAGAGVRHEHYYEQDFDILQKLHMNAFRFGVEWARLQPREGEWNEAAFDHYLEYILSLKRRGIEPVLTLWHWTMPVWFAEKGGFECKQNMLYFEAYVDKIMERFGTEVRYVLTMNEPNVYTAFSYISGEWPPQKRNPLIALRLYRNLALAHRKAYAAIKRVNPEIKVGVPMHLGNITAANTHNALNRALIIGIRKVWNWWFLDMVRDHQDFIGVNYYFTDVRDWRGKLSNPKSPVNDLGWYMDPSGIQAVLISSWKRYRRPLLITENGVADSTDAYREWWLGETIQALEKAQEQGVEIWGYLHWSLLDNFEWAYGRWPKFGLVAIDRKTMERHIRPSALWFAKQIQSFRTR